MNYDLHLQAEALLARMDAMLPAAYQHRVQTQSMGSAGLLYDADGNVAWDKIWTSFCDLALAGGPPHRGTLLEPDTVDACRADTTNTQRVTDELCRAIQLCTGMTVFDEQYANWLGVKCESETAATWLQLAVVAENVLARRTGRFLYLPIGPAYRLEKEIKNVTVALAKSFHYWHGHLTMEQQGQMVFQPLVEPTELDPQRVEAARQQLADAVTWPVVSSKHPGWLGIQCQREGEAVWLQRCLVVESILSRRAGMVVMVPVGGDMERLRSSVSLAEKLVNTDAARKFVVSA